MAETLDSQINLVLGNVPEILGEDLTSDEIYEALLKVHQAIEILVDFYDTAGGLYVTLIDAQTISGIKTFTLAQIFTAGFSITNGGDIVLGTGTGTKIGTGVGQKLGFWNKTPVIQPAAALQAALTNSTGGTQDGTLADVSSGGAGTGDSSAAVVNDNFTDIYTLLNEIRTALVDVGIMKGSA